MGAWEATDPNTGDGSNADVTLTRYYSAGGVQLASKSTGGSTVITLGDVQGSAQVTVDASGEVTRNAYTPYGTKRAGSNVASAHGWLNQIADADTGLTYLNARYYDPALGRFLSPDPLLNPGDPRTLDPYRYADNNPIVFSDVNGLSPACVGLAQNKMTACWSAYAWTKTTGALQDSHKSVVASHGRMNVATAMKVGAANRAYLVALHDAGYKRDQYTAINAGHAADITDLARMPGPSLWGLGLSVAAGAACGIASGGTLAVACFAAVGAAAGLVDYSLSTSSLEFSTRDAMASTAIGAAFGAAGAGSAVAGSAMAGRLASISAMPARLPVAQSNIAATTATAAGTSISNMAASVASQSLNYTRTVMQNAGTRPYIGSPMVVDEIMAAATPRLDPGGVPSALRWDAPGAFNGTAGTYELVIDTSTNTVLHFLFKAG